MNAARCPPLNSLHTNDRSRDYVAVCTNVAAAIEARRAAKRDFTADLAVVAELLQRVAHS
jgi:hypothetical protein